jgi:hypothetical protein
MTTQWSMRGISACAAIYYRESNKIVSQLAIGYSQLTLLTTRRPSPPKRTLRS